MCAFGTLRLYSIIPSIRRLERFNQPLDSFPCDSGDNQTSFISSTCRTVCWSLFRTHILIMVGILPCEFNRFCRANANGLVRSFLQIFPDAYVTVGDSSINPSVRTVVYTVSMPWNEEDRFSIPIYLRAVFSERGYPIIFHIHCQTVTEQRSGECGCRHMRDSNSSNLTCKKALEAISKRTIP